MRAEDSRMVSYTLFPRLTERSAFTDQLGQAPTTARKQTLAVVAMTDRAHGEFRTWTPPPSVSASLSAYFSGGNEPEPDPKAFGGAWVENDRMPKTETEKYRRQALNALGVALLPDKALAATLYGYTPVAGTKSGPADALCAFGGLIVGMVVDIVEAAPYLAASGWFGVRSLYAGARHR
jgi:hypothetical protein